MTDFEETGDGASTLAEHKLDGEVERIVYESEDASYTVFRLRDAQGALFTAVGTVPGLTPGQTVDELTFRVDAKCAVLIADALVLRILFQIAERDEVADVQLVHLVTCALHLIQVFFREETTVT